MLQIAGDGLAQLGDSGAGGVAVLALGERAFAGGDDVVGRGEVRLSDAEIDD